MSSRSNPGTAPHGQGKKPSKSQVQKRQAAQRAMAAASGAKAARNKRLLHVFGPVLGVVILVVIGVVVYIGQDHSKKGNPVTAADQAVTAAVTSVPASVLDTVGVGTGTGPSNKLTGAALTADNKPKVLYVGAEWCPYCAAERWALAEAVSRFGTLTDLGQTASSPSDVDPNTPTLSFHGSKYTSDYITFTPVEYEDSNHNRLDPISSSDNKLFSTIGQNSYPFVDIAGKYQFGVQYDPGLLAGKTHGAVADAMSDPTSTIGKAIDGSANILTAAICSATNDQPSSVCTAKGVVAAKAKLDASS